MLVLGPRFAERDICGTLSALGGALQLIIDNMTAGTLQALDRFMTGAKQGFSNFLANIGKYLKAALADWIGLPETIFEFDFANASWGDYLGLIIDILGLSWQTLADMVSTALGPKFVSITVDVLGEIADLLDKGIGGWVQKKIDEFRELISDLSSSVT